MLPQTAALSLIEKACTLETYGVDPVKVKSLLHPKSRCHLGVTPRGIVEFMNNAQYQVLPWHSIVKISTDGKSLMIQVIDNVGCLLSY
ncbi:hypothetical protein Ciccas_005049 [Cichlidogyrus casuarinus]|uniref:FERM domain-containing protein n=1 Tax=Cichlidogyrus casuarinus TaxID=1844966 RepID=A0ABD2Q9R7_9PLAT